MTPMNRPHDRITDNRLQFHLRWKDHLEAQQHANLLINLNTHLETLHSSLTPPGSTAPYPIHEPLPRLEPTGCILTAFFTFLGIAAAIVTYHLHTYPVTP